MHILCPHCHNPIEVVKLTPREEITCSSCGSSFCLETESTTAHESQSGQKFGKFELLDTVGHGAFGTVHKARDPELDRTVAIKVPRTGNLAGPQELDRFLREARSAAQLHHPSIVAVHDVGQAGGVPYLVSDFVDGVTLADLLSSRQLAFREAAELLATVADALQYAHERGVVHRDVKPSNIMIGDDGVPRIMDFGLAKREAGEITMTIEGQVLGTPAYMSPEQARGDSHAADACGDVYSLGVVLFQLLTGELPFRGTQRMLLHQVLHDEPRPPRSLNDHIPRNLETICLKAMAKQPGRRYTTARDLADDLRRWLKGEPILARPVGRVERTAKWVRRNPTVAGSLAGAAAALLLGTTVSVFFGVDADHQAAQAQQDKAAAVTANKNLEAANTNLASANTNLSTALDDVKKSQHKLEGSIARSWLLPLSSKSDWLSDQEIEVLAELAANQRERVALRFVEEAVKEPTYLRRLGERREYTLHAAVGLDTKRRNQVERILVERLSGKEISLEEGSDLSLSIIALGDLDSQNARQVAVTLTQAMTKTRDPEILSNLAEGLSAVAARLEPKEADRLSAEAAATLIQAMIKTNDFNDLSSLARTLSVVTARLEPKEADRVNAEAAATLIQAMTKTNDPSILGSQAEGLSVVAAHLESKKAAATLTHAITQTQDKINTKARLASHLRILGRSLSAVATRLEPKEATKAAATLTQAMTKTNDPGALNDLACSLSAVAARLEPTEAARVSAEATAMLTQAMIIPSPKEYRLYRIEEALAGLCYFD